MKKNTLSLSALLAGVAIVGSVNRGQAELIGNWTFDETAGTTAADSINNNDATWKGSASGHQEWVVGLIGGATKNDDEISGAGSSEHFATAAIAQLAGATQATFSIWFNMNGEINNNSTYNGLMMSRSFDPGSSWGLAIANNGSPRKLDGRINGQSTYSDEIVIGGSGWHHAALVWDSVAGTRTVYYDGQPVKSETDTTVPIVSAADLRFGDDACCGGREFTGTLDDAALWDTALTDAEILNIYTLGLAGTGVVIPVGDTDGDGISDVDEQSGDINPFDINGNYVGQYSGGAPTDHTKLDSDDDGINDKAECFGEINPFLAGSIGAPPGDETDPNSADTDGDALPDLWEINNELDPNDDGTTVADYGAAGDPDMDLLTNLEEYLGVGLFDGTDPNEPDTDSDGLDDKQEVTGSANVDFSDEPSDPNDTDTDDDGLLDGEEVNGTLNPFLSGVLDAGYPTEAGDPTDPTSNDSDGDELLDKDETDNRLDPNDDGLGASDENGADGDPDEDALSNVDEIAAGTDPRDEDTDDDGLFDEEELGYSTDPLKFDTDGDTIGDGDEILGTQNSFGPEDPTEPTDADSDDDGISDGLELNATPQTDPNDDSSFPDIKPVAYWPLDETTGSETIEWIYANNGTSTGTPAWATGQIGNALDMQGGSANGQWFSTPQLTGLNGSVSITVCAWINPGRDNRGYQGIFSTRGEGSTANENWGLNMDPNAERIDNRVPVNATGSSTGIDSSVGPYSIDTWYHIAMVFNPHDVDGKTVRIYTDGIEDPTSGTETYPTTLAGTGWTIGVDLNDPNGRDFDGMIDDIAIFAAPLPAADIEAIYDAGILGTSVGTLYGLTAPAPPLTDFTVSAVVYDAVAETVDLTWSSAGAAATYSVLSTMDLALPKSSWDVEDSGITALTYQVTGVTDTKRFYVIEAN